MLSGNQGWAEGAREVIKAVLLQMGLVDFLAGCLVDAVYWHENKLLHKVYI